MAEKKLLKLGVETPVVLKGGPRSGRSDWTLERWVPALLDSGVIERRGTELWITDWEAYSVAQKKLIAGEEPGPYIAPVVFFFGAPVAPIAAEVIVGVLFGWGLGLLAGLAIAALAIARVLVVERGDLDPDERVFVQALFWLVVSAAVVVILVFVGVRYGWLWAAGPFAAAVMAVLVWFRVPLKAEGRNQPRELAERLGVSPGSVRSFLRERYPRDETTGPSPWHLDPDQVREVEDHFGRGKTK